MDHYLVSARKYRPSTFDSVVGQRALTSTLKNAIASGRLAHSYLFTGSRGVGKTSCARIFAKTINCEHPTADGEACNECASCRAFNAGNSLNIIEMDAASNNGVDAMRELVDQVMVAPTQGRYRVFIIDEVHMLSNAAFNAFLKTLEEPPAHVIFILATTEKHKIIPTILSRCQIYDFNTISIRDMVDHLKMVAANEGIAAEDSALALIARKADGAMRDALSIFDQVAASSRNNITRAAALESLNMLDHALFLRLLDAFLKGDVAQTWLIYKEVRSRGFDSHFFIAELAAFMRDLMVAREPATASLLDADASEAAQLTEAAQKCTPGFIYRTMCLLNEADLNYRTASGKQFLVELTLAKICQSVRPSTNSGRAGGQLKPIDRPAAPAEPAKVANVAKIANVEPMPAPKAPTPTPTLRPVGRGPTLRGRSQAAADERKPETTLTTQRSNPFTREAFVKAWETFMAAHPREQILVNTMRASVPQAAEGKDHAFIMTVANDMQLDLMGRQMPALLTHLRGSLENDLITIDVELETGPGSSSTWTEREVYENMRATIPSFSKFIADFELTLG